jgi:cyd operon protein YbgT
MWYFAWMLGIPWAVAFAVLNAMWGELMEDAAMRHDKLDAPGAMSRHGPAMAPTTR